MGIKTGIICGKCAVIDIKGQRWHSLLGCYTVSRGTFQTQACHHLPFTAVILLIWNGVVQSVKVPFYTLCIALIPFRCTMKNPDESWLCLSSCIYSSSCSSRQCQERHQIWESFYFVCFSTYNTLWTQGNSWAWGHVTFIQRERCSSPYLQHCGVEVDTWTVWTDSCRGPLRGQDTVWIVWWLERERTGRPQHSCLSPVIWQQHTTPASRRFLAGSWCVWRQYEGGIYTFVCRRRPDPGTI